jgi:hypothetical protein
VRVVNPSAVDPRPGSVHTLPYMDGIGVARSNLASHHWTCVAVMIAAVFVGLAFPAISQAQRSATHFCGTTGKGDFELEAGDASRQTSCRFARATYRAYRKWSLKHVDGHSHFQLRVRGHRLSCNRGIDEAEVGESVFVVQCHDRTKFVEMSSEKGL